MTDPPRVTSIRHGVDLVVHGGPDRDRTGRRLVDELDAVCEHGLRLLREFLADTFAPGRGEFDLLSVEVSDEVTLRFAWLDATDPVEFGNTWFDVGYFPPDPRREDTFRPVRFEIGFW